MQLYLNTDESKPGNVSATANSARSDVKKSFNQENFSKRVNHLVLKKHLSDLKKTSNSIGKSIDLNNIESPQAQSSGCVTKLSSYMRKLDSGKKLSTINENHKILNTSGKI